MKHAASHILLLASLAPLVMMLMYFEQWKMINSASVGVFYMVMAFLWALYIGGYWFALSQRSMMLMLYLAFFISVSTLLKTLPLPLGMTLAFLIPMLAAVYIHPLWGLMIGLLAQGLSALLFGGIGPWTPMQMMLFALFSGVLLWVPCRIRINLIFQLGYLFVWGLFYGFAMSLYFWPAIAPDQVTTQWGSFWGLYVTTSLFWDFFRAAGNVMIWLVAYRALKPYFIKVDDWIQ